MKTVRDIIKQYLQENGYDGLAGYECGCEISDLFPCSCSDSMPECEPGHKVPCDPEQCPADGDCPWHMEPGKKVD